MAAIESPGIHPADAEPYYYVPISYEGLSIRLLTLLPGAFASKVMVKLHEIPFSNPPVDANGEYEALSYCWGSFDDPKHIYVEDEDAETCYVLRVTSNLEQALRYLRFEDKPRVLWVDAVCVDQNNLVDRSYHVGRMAHIYPSATRVIIWLGAGSDDSDAAIDILRQLKGKTIIHWATRTMTPSSPEPSEAHWADRSVSLPFNEAQILAIHHLLSRHWFERLWVWQEVRLAATANIQCGNSILEWEAFREAMMLVYHKALPRYAPNGFIERAEQAYWLCIRYGTESLNSLLQFTKDSRCLDERDRVYALLSMTGVRKQDLGIRADYSKPYYDVYKDAVVKYATNWKDLELFSTIDPSRLFDGKASWVPDWSKPRLSACLWWLKRFAPTHAIAVDLGDDQLQVSGIQVATIDQVEEFDMPSSGVLSSQQMISALRTVVSRFGIRDKLLGSEAYKKQFCNVLTVGRYAESNEPPNMRFPTLDQGAAALHHILTDSDTHLTHIEEDFYTYAKSFCQARAFFTTSEGRFGVAPMTTQAGDIATIILGCNTPTILRPQKEGSSYAVVGEAYLSGMMNSEALLGPLPDHYEQVAIRDNKKSRVWWVLKDHSTGIMHVEDPRLGELPAGWIRRPHEGERFFTWFVNQETGEELIDGYDPRLTREGLREAGAEIQDFVLV